MLEVLDVAGAYEEDLAYRRYINEKLKPFAAEANSKAEEAATAYKRR